MAEVDLITGATGFLGGNLARVLVAQGQRVRILVRPTSRLAHLADLPLEMAAGDVTDLPSLEKAMAGVRHVYHCAARVTVARHMTGDVWAANVRGTENVVRAARAAGIERLVHCSSVDALGLPEGDDPADEETPWNWERLRVANAYARSKLEAHRLVLQAAGDGLNAVVVCPTFMLGAYDAKPSSGRLILACARYEVLPRPDGGNNFVDVLDVAEGMVAAAARGRTGEAYILGNANLTYADAFALIGSALGHRARLVPMPKALALPLGLAGDLAERAGIGRIEVNSAIARLGYLRHYYSTAKALRELGLRRRPVAAAIERGVAWFRQVGMLPAA